MLLNVYCKPAGFTEMMDSSGHAAEFQVVSMYLLLDFWMVRDKVREMSE